MRSSIQVLFLSFLLYGTYGEEAERRSSLDSLLNTIGSMNATLVDMGRRMRGVEDKVSNIQGTIARFANLERLEPIQRALAEEERRRKPERELRDRLLLNPRAKLYTGLNYTGDLESYDFNTPTYKGGCYNLTKLKGKIKSVNTEGTCVRIFATSYCSSWSQALYPGSSAAIDPRLRGVTSVGPCMSNEFKYATLSMSGNPFMQTVNKRAEEVAAFANLPDLVPGFWAQPGRLYKLNNSEPITHYMLGQGGQLEGVNAKIYLRHILSPAVAEGNRLAGLDQRFFPDLEMIPSTDEPGYVVPLELGGPAKEAYNVFAQDKGQAVKYRAFLLPMIKQYLAENPDSSVNLGVALLYPDSASKRPAGVWCRVWTDGIMYGYFPNVVLGLIG